MFRKEKTQPATETSPNVQSAETSPAQQAAQSLMGEVAVMKPKAHRHNQLAHGETYRSTVLMPPIANESHMGGNVEVGLTQLVFVGESVLGITHHRNTKRPPAESLEAVSVSLLPIGPHASAEGAAKVIERVDVGALSLPNPQGNVEPWKRITVGRNRLAELNGGKEDPMVSASHLEITVGAGGGVGFRDNSLNGTQVLEHFDFDKIHTGLSEKGQTAFLGVTNTLKEYPATWDPEIGRHANGAQVRVINPDPRF